MRQEANQSAAAAPASWVGGWLAGMAAGLAQWRNPVAIEAKPRVLGPGFRQLPVLPLEIWFHVLGMVPSHTLGAALAP